MGGDTVAVVREEDDHRVVVDPAGLEHLHDAAHLAVDALHKAVVGVQVTPPVVLRVGGRIVIARRSGAFERKGFGRIGRRHEIGREVGTLRGQERLQFAVLQRLVAPVLADFVGIEQRGHQEERFAAVVLLQCGVAGVGQRRVAHLRDAAESRARVGQVDLRNVPFPGIETLVTRPGDAVADASLHIGLVRAVGVVEGPYLEGHAARDERSAAGTAQRIGAIGARETYAVGGQRIHRRGLNPRISGARHGSGGLLVGHDDDNAGTLAGSRFVFGGCGSVGRHRQGGERCRQCGMVQVSHKSVFKQYKITTNPRPEPRGLSLKT